MDRIRTLIVDDEKQARVSLRELIQLCEVPLEVVAEADGVHSALEKINEFRPDLVLLDIQLGDGSGFEVLEKSILKNFKVIFITAYDQFALQAFRFSAVDYLLKPVSEQDFRDSVAKVILSGNTFGEHPNIAAMLYNQQNHASKKIGIRGVDSITLFDTSEIIRCEGDGSYARVFFEGSKNILSAKTLKDFETQLTPYGFERVHNSHLINMKHLKKYINRDGGLLIMSNGDEIPLAQRKRAYILGLIS